LAGGPPAESQDERRGGGERSRCALQLRPDRGRIGDGNDSRHAAALRADAELPAHHQRHFALGRVRDERPARLPSLPRARRGPLLRRERTSAAECTRWSKCGWLRARPTGAPASASAGPYSSRSRTFPPHSKWTSTTRTGLFTRSRSWTGYTRELEGSSSPSGGWQRSAGWP